MAGTLSRTATALSRGIVGRQPQANPRPEAHESHTRRFQVCEEARRSKAQSHVEELMGFSREHWDRISGEIREGKYTLSGIEGEDS